ncbi:tyrosine recombinase XerC [Bacteroidia bacterium]|nr:tyrosine recombinase XerC [Bacteroidia bacterium]
MDIESFFGTFFGAFLEHLKNVKRYSPHTLTAYEEDIRQFSNYIATLKDIREFKDITPKFVRNWVVVEMSNALKPATVRRKLSSVRAYFKYLMREGVLENDPTEMIPALKIGKKLPVFVNDYQMDALLDGLGVFKDGFAGFRDRLVLLTAYCTGMRRAELVGMRVQDVNFSARNIIVTGKGAKQRLVPIATELSEDMKLYLELREEVLSKSREGKGEGQEHDVFFVTDKGRPVYDKFIYRLAHNLLATCTTLSKRSPHILRHTFATHLLNNGACIEAIRELLGHSDLAATQVYTHNSFERLVKIYNGAHPRAQ